VIKSCFTDSFERSINIGDDVESEDADEEDAQNEDNDTFETDIYEKYDLTFDASDNQMMDEWLNWKSVTLSTYSWFNVERNSESNLM
jgi:hypothetical protein